MFLILLLGLAATSTTACSTYQYDHEKGCYEYQPVCLTGNRKRTCSTNGQGCKVCHCYGNGYTDDDPAKRSSQP